MHHGLASFAGVRASRVVGYADLRTNPAALADGGWWAVVAEFDGPWHAWRFAEVQHSAQARTDDGAPSGDGAARVDGGGAAGGGAADGEGAGAPDGAAGTWQGPAAESWTSSMSERVYVDAVAQVRAFIRAGQVYQANICRVLSAPLPDRPDAVALAGILAAGNPAPYGGYIDIPPGLPGSDPDGCVPPAWVVTASPELGLSVRDGAVTSGPIKGTAPRADLLAEKDRAENVMIADLVRNDLQRACDPGTVAVTDLLAVEHHPGLVHLVSRVRGRLSVADLAADGGRGWAELLDATQPPGSVSGAPKSAALDVIAQLETARRGPYCGQIGWVDADAGTACLAVGIRTFWWAGGALHFGTGAGITYGSDPQGEWEETRLKAARLVGLASR